MTKLLLKSAIARPTRVRRLKTVTQLSQRPRALVSAYERKSTKLSRMSAGERQCAFGRGLIIGCSYSRPIVAVYLENDGNGSCQFGGRVVRHWFDVETALPIYGCNLPLFRRASSTTRAPVLILRRLN